MSYFNDVMSYLEERRQRAVNGLYNCIPLPFKRFRTLVPGIEQGRYIIVTASQKIGKTKFCDFMFVYETLFFLMEHPEVKVKILYFCLEESARKKIIELQCHLLYRLNNIHISPTELESTDKDHPVSEEVLNLLRTKEYQDYIRKYEELVEFITEDKNPTGIKKRCWDYALEHGKLNKKTIRVKDSFGMEIDKEIIDPVNPYTPDDPELYKIVIIDNASNISTEKGMNLMDSIEKVSKDAITLRNQFNYTVVLVQHQAQSKEGDESFKLNRIKPSSDGLADSKKTTRDVDMVIGLYSPFKYGIPTYEGYDITKFRNHIRFMEIIEDRHYGANGNICPLYFDGAVSYFFELPKADNAAEMTKVYNFIDKNKLKKNFITLISFSNIVNLFKRKKNDRITN